MSRSRQKGDHSGYGNNKQKNLDITSANFKQMSNNYYGALELALLARSLLMLYKRLYEAVFFIFRSNTEFHRN